MRHLVHLIPITAILFTGCDDAPAAECPNAQDLAIVSPIPADEIEFREKGDPEAWYLYKWGQKKITSTAFAKAVLLCEQVEAPIWYLTLSGYLPDVTVTDERVVGLGGSAITTSKWWNCMLEQFKAAGAIQL